MDILIIMFIVVKKNAFYKLSLINHFIFSLQRFEFIENFGIIEIKTD